MKILFVFLCFGTFLSCFYLECKALKYHGYEQDQPGENSENTFIDSLRHHRSRRNVDGNTTFCPTVNCTEKINHKYYVSHTFKDGQKYWRDIRGNPKTIEHGDLSDHFLQSKSLKLSFQFPYYGHYLDSVRLTTGGFLYMDVHNTKLITDVQYLAPLMAYFSSKLHVDSKVLTQDDGNQLTVQWFHMYLHNKTDVGPFNFQCTLHKDGTIWFAYKQIPIPVETLRDVSYHPVRVGISDAFVILYKDPRRPVIYRFFFIYSQVNITKKSVVNGSAVVFYPQPSCVGVNSCQGCLRRNQTTEFDCRWCPATKKCSDGADRHRAEWENARCAFNAVEKISDERCVAEGFTRKRKSKGGIGAGAVVGICIVLVLVICVAAWCVYAYRNPTSKSGLFLIDAARRPREFFKRSSDGGVRTGDAAPSDIKPQVL